MFLLFLKFPQNTSAKVEEPVISSAWYSSKNKTQNKTQNFPPLQSQQDNIKSKPAVATPNTSTYVTAFFFFHIISIKLVLYKSNMSNVVHGKLIAEVKAKHQMDPLIQHGRRMANNQFKIKMQMEIPDLVVMQKN